MSNGAVLRIVPEITSINLMVAQLTADISVQIYSYAAISSSSAKLPVLFHPLLSDSLPFRAGHKSSYTDRKILNTNVFVYLKDQDFNVRRRIFLN
jgi:hypothetical protein